jgi:hypothetical protein
MAYGPQDSSIRLNETLEERINKATSAVEIQALLKEAAVAQNLVSRDRFDPDVLLATEAASAPTPHRFARAIEVDGQKHFIESDSEVGLEKATNDFLRQTFSTPAATQTQSRDAATGRFAAEPAPTTDATDAYAKAELELRFKRGEISTDEYLAQSGAIERHLAAQGIDMDAMRDASGRRFEQSWEQATQEFLHSSIGRSWPGGQENMRRISEVLQQMGAVDAPSAENLALAYQHLRENDLLCSNPEAEARQKIAESTTFEEIVENARRAIGR